MPTKDSLSALDFPRFLTFQRRFEISRSLIEEKAQMLIWQERKRLPTQGLKGERCLGIL